MIARILKLSIQFIISRIRKRKTEERKAREESKRMIQVRETPVGLAPISSLMSHVVGDKIPLSLLDVCARVFIESMAGYIVFQLNLRGLTGL